jgi:general secretion pathway protein A
MYLNFYQLHKKPFSLAPDPEFLYLSQQHKDALGAIVYGIREREGFVSIVGEVGTGKTTIVRSFLHKAGRNKILPIFIFNSRITFSELMKTFLSEIGLDVDALQGKYNVNDMVRLAYKSMLEKTREGKNLVLIIDEAQNMPVETLGNLCILSNFETSKAKLIQIVLVGQPELQKKLDLYELRQLRQRIAYRALITPLSIKESIGYLHHRLSLSSKGQKPVFTTSAIRRIVKHSKGVPRVINILCENSLVAGYGLQKKPVSLKLVKQVIAEYEGSRFSGQLLLKKVAGSMLILLLAALLVDSYFPSPQSPEESMGEQGHFTPPSMPHLQPVSINDRAISSSKKVVEQIEDEIPTLVRNAETVPASDDSNSPPSPVETFQLQTREPLSLIPLPEVSRDPSTTTAEEITSLREKLFELISKAESIFDQSTGLDIPSKQSAHTKIVKKGDTLSTLCLETYGFVTMRALVWLKTHNPHISNMDEIQIDEIIFFPEMETPNLLHMPQRVNNRSITTKGEVVSR